MRENEANDYNEKLRKVKNEHFNGMEKLQQIINVKDKTLRELQDLEQELHRVSNKLS
jgi:hypothetical protein